MKLLTRIFAFIGFLVVGSFTLGLLIGFIFTPRAPTIPAQTVLQLDFATVVSEVPGSDPLTALLEDPALPLRSLIQAIDRATKDERVKGLVADTGNVTLGPAQLQEVRAAIGRFRDSGKFTYTYADSFGEIGPGNRQYWLASAFEQIWLQPLGGVGLTGGAMSLPFARDALDKLGVRADVRQRYEYKGAADSFTERSLPAPLRQNYQRLLDDLHAQMLGDIGTARKIEAPELRQLVNRAPLSGEAALKAGLIDRIAYRDELVSAVRTQAGEAGELVPLGAYLAGLEPLTGEAKARVTLIYVDGPIVRRSDESGPFGEQEVAGADDIVAAIETATEDTEVKAIVLRVNSPGGSVPASESIHRAISLARQQGKFVVVSMGDMAASGGYWIASAADKILASPATITGSIGVVGGKMVIGGLSEKLGINWEELGTGANSTMFSPSSAFSPSASVAIDAALDDIYQTFTQRVADGRNLKPAQIDALARGRVWSGARAKELGLVDELGGLREAFTLVRTQLGLSEDDVLELMILPAPESTTDMVLKLLGQLASAPRLGISLPELQQGLARLVGGGALSPAGSLLYTGPQNWQ